MAPPARKSPTEDGPRWRRRAADRPAEIVAAALACFVEKGYAATRLEDVAARAGVTKGTVYLYFKGKEALFEAMVREALVPNIERAEALVAAHQGSQGELLRLLAGRLASVIGQDRLSGIPRLVLGEITRFPDLARFYRRAAIERVLGLVAGVIERGMKDGEFRPVPPRHAARALVSPIIFSALWRHGFAGLEGEAPEDPAPFIASHLDIFMQGIARETPP